MPTILSSMIGLAILAVLGIGFGKFFLYMMDKDEPR